jgi:dihydrofolate synthase/folylpolyglutamate synthase
MTYTDAIEFLYELRWFGAKLGLANTFKLASLAGNPHHGLRFIHVAGTNGKGSTCAMLEAIYRAAGLRVGLYTSPHLVAFGERIQVNRQSISEDDVVRLLTGLRPLFEQFSAVEHPTFFEVVTVMALQYFAAQKCDLVIWETGLGGRLDATNIVTPLASVITNIERDHEKWLGDGLASIAAEKAGIIKPGVRVITATDQAEALEVIQETARREKAPLIHVRPADPLHPILDGLQLSLRGRHQKVNAALAMATVRALDSVLPVRKQIILDALERVSWPGRLQLINGSPGQQFLLDGAHNLAGAQVLAEAIRELFPAARPALMLGILEDKDWAGMCRTLAPLACRIAAVPVKSERTVPPEQLCEACRGANPSAEVSAFPSLGEAMAWASDSFIVVTGSLYLVGEMLERLQTGKGALDKERSLNEWSLRT